MTEMTPLLRVMENRLMMFAMGTLGDSCTCMGVYAAVKYKKVMRMISQTWFMLSFVFYLYFIMSILSRQIDTIERVTVWVTVG